MNNTFIYRRNVATIGKENTIDLFYVQVFQCMSLKVDEMNAQRNLEYTKSAIFRVKFQFCAISAENSATTT